MHNPFNEVDNWRDENDDSALGPMPIILVLVPVMGLLYLAIWLALKAWIF